MAGNTVYFAEVKAGDIFRHRAGDKYAKTYFAFLHGRWIFLFPIENGKVCRKGGGDEAIFPADPVEILSADEIRKLGLPFNENGTLAEDKMWAE